MNLRNTPIGSIGLFGLLLLAAGMVGLTPSTAAAQSDLASTWDQVIIQDDSDEFGSRPVYGRIQTITRTDLVIKEVDEDGRLGNFDETYSLSEVNNWTVNYNAAGRTPSLGQARSEMTRFNWVAAAQAFHASLNPERGGTPFGKHISLVHLVECAQQIGSARVSIGGSQATGYAFGVRYAAQLDSEFGQSFYRFETIRRSAECLESSGDTVEAEQRYGDLVALNYRRPEALLTKAEFSYRTARNGGNVSSARSEFQAALRVANELGDRDVADRARVGEGMCAINLGQMSAAIALFNVVIGDDESGSQDGTALGRAYLGIGIAQLSSAVQSNNREAINAAFLSLSRAAVVFETNIPEAEANLAVGLMARIAAQLAENDEELWGARASVLRREWNGRTGDQPLPAMPDGSGAYTYAFRTTTFEPGQ